MRSLGATTKKGKFWLGNWIQFIDVVVRMGRYTWMLIKSYTRRSQSFFLGRKDDLDPGESQRLVKLLGEIVLRSFESGFDGVDRWS